jgi:surfeit locus 1 family protein
MSSTLADAGRRFRPRLWPSLWTLFGLVVLVGLGTWQLQRLAWKEDLIRRAEAQLAETAMPIPLGPLDGLDFRRLSARGTYLHEAAFAFGLTAFDGQPGARLVTPLRLEDGRVILVDRGWLPQSLLPPNTPPDLKPAGPVTVEGIGRWRGNIARGWMAPNDSPAQRRWFNWDIPSLEGALGLQLAPLELVLERSDGPAGLPRAERVEIDFPNNHLSYALTWYGLAGALLVIYILFSSSKPEASAP